MKAMKLFNLIGGESGGSSKDILSPEEKVAREEEIAKLRELVDPTLARAREKIADANKAIGVERFEELDKTIDGPARSSQELSGAAEGESDAERDIKEKLDEIGEKTLGKLKEIRYSGPADGVSPQAGRAPSPPPEVPPSLPAEVAPPSRKIFGGVIRNTPPEIVRKGPPPTPEISPAAQSITPEIVGVEKHALERELTPEEKLAEFEIALEGSRNSYVRAEGDYRKAEKEFNKFRGLNLNKFAAGPRNEEYDAAIRRREAAIAEYQKAKQALAGHIWGEKKNSIAGRLGKKWDDFEDGERTAAEGELAEFKAREIFPRFVIGEATKLSELKLQSWPPKEQGVIKKILNGYLKLSSKQRLVISTIAVGSVVAATGGLAGAGGAALWGVQRIARGAASVWAGQNIGGVAGRGATALMGTEEKKAAAMEKLEKGFSPEDLGSADAEYVRIAKAEKADERKQLVVKAAAMLATGAGLNILSGQLIHAADTSMGGKPNLRVIGGSSGGGTNAAASAADHRGPVPHPEPAPPPPGASSGHDVVGRTIDIKPKAGAEAVISTKPTPEVVPPSGGSKIKVFEEAASEKSPADYVSKAPEGGLKSAESWRPEEDALAGKGMLLAPEQLHERALDAAATVKPGEGAWQAVHRQLELRLNDPAKYPRKGYFGLAPEEPSDSVAAKHALDVKTMEILKKEHFIDNDGSTLVGIKNDGFRVRLDDSDHVFVEKAGMPAVLDKSGTYTFKNVHGASGAAIGETAPAPIIENIPVAEVAPESAAAVIEGSTTAGEHAANISHGVPSISETFFVKVPENFTFRNLIYEQLQKHYGDRLVEFDQYGRDRITGLFERYLADHPETIRGTDLSTLKPGEKIDFTGLFGDQNIVNERFHEATKWMLERLDMGANELKLLSSFGFNAEYPPDVHALGIIRGMKIGDFLDRFHENHIQNGGLVSFTDPDNDSVTVLLGRRHIKLAELLRNANLSPADRDKMTIAEFLKDVH